MGHDVLAEGGEEGKRILYTQNDKNDPIFIIIKRKNIHPCSWGERYTDRRWGDAGTISEGAWIQRCHHTANFGLLTSFINSFVFLASLNIMFLRSSKGRIRSAIIEYLVYILL